MAYLKKLEADALRREERISQLRMSLHASQARVSTIQSRLLSALDTVDNLQQTRFEEADQMTKENKRLKTKIRRLKEHISDMASERDDMRDAVEELLQRVERKTDYLAISPSTMSVYGAIQPMASSLADRSLVRINQAIEGSAGYAANLIKSLSSHLESEKEAHRQSGVEAAQKITMLEAQLAQREATIESFVTAPPLAGEGKNQPNPHTSESDVSMLAERVSRNLQLEQEVILLAQKVEDARLEAKRKADESLRVKPEPVVLRVEHSLRKGSDNVATSSRPLSPTTQSVLRSLDVQISALNEEIDVLQTERETLYRADSGLLGESDLPGGANVDFIVLLEEECIQLRASEQAAREALHDLQESSEKRESELQETITMLEHRLSVQERELVAIRTSVPEDDTFTTFSISLPHPSQQSPLADPFMSFTPQTTAPAVARESGLLPSLAPPSPSPFATPRLHPFSSRPSRMAFESPSGVRPTRARSPPFPSSSVTASSVPTSPLPPSYPAHLEISRDSYRLSSHDTIEKELEVARVQVREKDELLRKLQRDLDEMREQSHKLPP